MALHYYRTKKILWVKGEKKTQYIVKHRVQGTYTEEDIAEKLTKSLSMEAPEVLLLMDELADQITSAVLNGQRVKVDGLGTFSPSLKTKSNENLEDVTTDSIQKVKINFRPDVKLKRAMDDTKLEYYSQIKTQYV